MRNTGNILIVPGVSEREKKMSAFKTISFLLSPPENESVTTFSDHLIRNKGDRAKVHDPEGD